MNKTSLSSSPTMHEVPLTERPRERLYSQGVGALSSTELLSIILGMGTAGHPVMKISQQLLQHFGSLQAMSHASMEELRQVVGLGPAKASCLLACIELSRRVSQEAQSSQQRRSVIEDPGQLADRLRHSFNIQDQEHYWVVSLSSRNHVIAIDAVSIGIIDAALVHPRETFAMAIRRRAAKIIMCHNHPSGECKPSEDDCLITKRLQTAGKIIGIPVIDHVIVTQTAYYSFHQKGQLAVNVRDC